MILDSRGYCTSSMWVSEDTGCSFIVLRVQHQQLPSTSTSSPSGLKPERIIYSIEREPIRIIEAVRYRVGRTTQVRVELHRVLWLYSRIEQALNHSVTRCVRYPGTKQFRGSSQCISLLAHIKSNSHDRPSCKWLQGSESLLNQMLSVAQIPLP